MRLYWAYSPNSLKARLALAECGLEPESTRYFLAGGEHRNPEFEAINPHLKVPALTIDGVHIAESNAIVQHLGRTRGGELWPSDAAEDAVLSRWLFFEASSLAAWAGTLWWSDHMHAKRGVKPRPEARNEAAEEELKRPMGVLQGLFASRPYLLGETPSLADGVIATATSLLSGTRADPAERWPEVAAHAARIRARPSWAAAEGERCLHHAD